jgi:hypothetical protein
MSLQRAGGALLLLACIGCEDVHTADAGPAADDATAESPENDAASPGEPERDSGRDIDAEDGDAGASGGGAAGTMGGGAAGTMGGGAAGTMGGGGGPGGADAGQDSGEPEPRGRGEILTNRYDNARTGANLNETTLNRANVAQLELLGSWPLDGEVYAQVLIADAVPMADGAHAVAVVATMNDSLYAFDADAAPDQALLWHVGEMRELGMPGLSPRNVGGPNGILSTPVIDKPSQSVFLVARNCPGGSSAPPALCEHRLFRIALASGAIESSVTIEGQVPLGDVSGAGGSVIFDPAAHWNRPGLLLADHELYVAFGSGPTGNQHEEDFVYHGWLFRYDARDLGKPPDVFCTTPRGRGGSVWQAGAAPAADALAVYFTGANGIMDDSQTHPPTDWPSAPKGQEDSVVSLDRGKAFPTPDQAVPQYNDLRSYHPDGNVFQYMESGDNGFGSSGPMLIPDTRLLLVGTKAGLVYLLDRGSMFAVREPLNPFTDLPLQAGHELYLHSWWGIPVVTQSFVFWRPHTTEQGSGFGYAYAWASNDRLRALRFEYDTLDLKLQATSPAPAIAGGGNIVLSADGDVAESGVLWAATRSPAAGTPSGELWAIDPFTLRVLWQTSYPAWSKFNPPTVARGRVYLPSTAPGAGVAQQVLVYGLSGP